MQQKDKESLEIITCIMESVYKLNVGGYYTAWLDWSGHTGGIYIKIIKGKWQKGKREKIMYEALLCTRFNKWKDGMTGKDFDLSDFLQTINKLAGYHVITI